MLRIAEELATLEHVRNIITELSIAMSEEVPQKQRESALVRASAAAEEIQNERDRVLVDELIHRTKEVLSSHQSTGWAIWPFGHTTD